MKKKHMIYAVVMVAFAIVFWALHTETKTTIAVAETKVEAPAKSVKEFADRYKSVDLTPSQKRLVAEGLDPFKTHNLTIK